MSGDGGSRASPRGPGEAAEPDGPGAPANPPEGDDPAAPGHRLKRMWARLSPLPGGNRVFSRLLAWMVPYSGTVGAVVTELEPGLARVRLRERRRVRNHLDSVHAVALTNLGELSAGLATLTALPAGVRGIVVALETRYTKKARGVITAECRTALPRMDARAGAVSSPGGGTDGDLDTDTEHRAEARLTDEEGDVVAVVTATWRLSPVVGQ